MTCQLKAVLVYCTNCSLVWNDRQTSKLKTKDWSMKLLLVQELLRVCSGDKLHYCLSLSLSLSLSLFSPFSKQLGQQAVKDLTLNGQCINLNGCSQHLFYIFVILSYLLVLFLSVFSYIFFPFCNPVFLIFFKLFHSFVLFYFLSLCLITHFIFYVSVLFVSVSIFVYTSILLKMTLVLTNFWDNILV